MLAGDGSTLQVKGWSTISNKDALGDGGAQVREHVPHGDTYENACLTTNYSAQALLQEVGKLFGVPSLRPAAALGRSLGRPLAGGFVLMMVLVQQFNYRSVPPHRSSNLYPLHNPKNQHTQSPNIFSNGGHRIIFPILDSRFRLVLPILPRFVFVHDPPS